MSSLSQAELVPQSQGHVGAHRNLSRTGAGGIGDSCSGAAGLLGVTRALTKFGLAVQDLNFYPSLPIEIISQDF